MTFLWKFWRIVFSEKFGGWILPFQFLCYVVVSSSFFCSIIPSGLEGRQVSWAKGGKGEWQHFQRNVCLQICTCLPCKVWAYHRIPWNWNILYIYITKYLYVYTANKYISIYTVYKLEHLKKKCWCPKSKQKHFPILPLKFQMYSSPSRIGMARASGGHVLSQI